MIRTESQWQHFLRTTPQNTERKISTQIEKSRVNYGIYGVECFSNALPFHSIGSFTDVNRRPSSQQQNCFLFFYSTQNKCSFIFLSFPLDSLDSGDNFQV